MAKKGDKPKRRLFFSFLVRTIPDMRQRISLSAYRKKYEDIIFLRRFMKDHETWTVGTGITPVRLMRTA